MYYEDVFDMQTYDFWENNKCCFMSDHKWETLLGELETAKHFLDDLGFLAFGGDIRVIRSNHSLRPVWINRILQSTSQTVQSMIACSEYGNIADVHVLLRKLRDDLFFYLYVIVVCKKENILSSDELSKQEKYINAWAKNQLSHLNISRIIQEITSTDECIELVEKFGLKDELRKISSTLNNYTHGNGTLYYNRSYTQYRDDELRNLSTELIFMLNYILIAFLFLLILVSPLHIMSSDYVDALELSMTPEENSQYWVAPFVSSFIEKHKDLLGKEALEYLRSVTLMEI